MRYADMFGPTPRGSAGFDLTFGDDNSETRARLRELILYISEKSRHDIKFSATKLNKILYYSDFVSFKTYGQPVTGAQYMRLEYGPVPTHLKPLRQEMVEQGDIVIEKREYWTRTQDVVKPLRRANITIFSAQEIALVDGIIDELWEFDANEVSARSHKRAWKVTNYRDAIPYEAIFLSDEPLSEDDMEWAYGAAINAGWADAF
jgi:uncharacterized phage-associated protein